MLLASRDFFFFFNDTATTEIYTLSLHDALPISPTDVSETYRRHSQEAHQGEGNRKQETRAPVQRSSMELDRSEEHTSELQSRQYLVCRLLLEKKKKKIGSTDVSTYYTRRTRKSA